MRISDWSSDVCSSDPGHYVRWLCLCDCGNRVVTRAQSLRDGKTKSCGCKYDGRSNTATYSSWSSMKKRCLNPKAADYPRYGGRGITVTRRWLRSEEHTSELQSLMRISYAVFCLKKKKITRITRVERH